MESFLGGTLRSLSVRDVPVVPQRHRKPKCLSTTGICECIKSHSEEAKSEYLGIARYFEL